ncbi:hypothetical protein L7F22_056976 [Adiantum nelumboides]|nr:hypothetical protein [Adiantum nelumboides]
MPRIESTLVALNPTEMAEFLLVLSMINKVTRVHVPHTTAHDIFMMQKLGLADPKSILDKFDNEDRAKAKRVLRGTAMNSSKWLRLPMALLSQLLWKEKIQKLSARDTRKYMDHEEDYKASYAMVRKGLEIAVIANPDNGSNFFRLCISFPGWGERGYKMTTFRVSEIACAYITSQEKCRLLGLLASGDPALKEAGISSNEKPFSQWLRMHVYWWQLKRKSHNEASRGVVIYDPQGNLVIKRGLKLTAESNNEAEYATLKKGLQLCLELGIQRVKIKGDALLVVKQVLAVWQSKNPRLKNMCFHVKNLLKHFEAWSLRNIDRSHNEEAHATAKAMIGQLYVMRVDSPLYLGREYLDKEEGFLQTGLLPAELEKSKKYAFLRRAKRYVFVGDSLYMKGADLVMQRVPWKEEIYKVLEENHEGSCGGHFASKITLHKILQEGYVWPSIQRDVHH